MTTYSHNKPRNRRPFVQLDLRNIPQHCSTELNFRSLSPKVVNIDTAEERAIAFAKSIVNQSNIESVTPKQSTSKQVKIIKTNEKGKSQRLLSPIPLEYETLLRQQWPMTQSTPIKYSQKWCKKLSNNMNLEIESDPKTGKTLCLRLINSEDQCLTYNSSTHECKRETDTLEIERSLSFSSSSSSSSSLLSSKPVFDMSTDSGLSISYLESPNSSSGSGHYCARTRFIARHRCSHEPNLERGDDVDVLLRKNNHNHTESISCRTDRHDMFDNETTSHHHQSFTKPYEEHSVTQQLPLINFRIRRERYLLDFLGSIEVTAPKGESIVSAAIGQIILQMNNVHPHRCTLEISDIGLRMLNAQACLYDPLLGHGNRIKSLQKSNIDYFFSLLQITYCGYQMLDENYYFAFITRHPSAQFRYACHVFRTTPEMANLAEAVGHAFYRFYNRFVEVTLPLDSILNFNKSQNCFV